MCMKALGPGLLESAYVKCLIDELKVKEFESEHEKSLPIFYKNVILECGYRLDLIVEDQIIVDGKSVKDLGPINEPQLLSYLKMSNCNRGLLLNFNVMMFKDGGIKRMVI